MKRCIKAIGYGWDRCSRAAVVEINGWDLCKQHAIKELPCIKILPRVENKEGLKRNLIGKIFNQRKEQ